MLSSKGFLAALSLTSYSLEDLHEVFVLMLPHSLTMMTSAPPVEVRGKFSVATVALARSITSVLILHSTVRLRVNGFAGTALQPN